MKRRMQLLIGFLLLLAGPVPHLAESYEPQPIETLIQESDLIVIGRVEKTSVYEDKRGDGIRRTTLRIQEIIKGDKAIGETIVVEHFEGVLSKAGEIEEYSSIRPIFTSGAQTLLLLNRFEDTYAVAGAFRGKIDIIEGRVAGTDVAVADLKAAIKRVDRKEVSKLEVDISAQASDPDDCVQRGGQYHLDGQFCAATDGRYRHHPPPLTITFHINPSGAIDGDGDPIPFNELKAAMDSCVVKWNRLEDSDIKFQVAESETNRTHNRFDAWSTVTFEAFPSWDKAAARATLPREVRGKIVSDIRFNTRPHTWTTSEQYPSSWPAGKPKDFMDVMTHELGHSAGLIHSHPKHKNNTMYYESKRDETKRRTLEWGDKAGGVYMTTAPGIGKNGELGFSQDWSAFTGSGQPITLHKNITVVEKKTLTLEQGLFIDMGENENTISAGRGTINGTATPVVSTPRPPDAPRNLKTTSGFGQIGLDWDAPILNGGLAITRYEYRYQVSGGNWSSWSSVGLATDATQTGLADNTTYNFEVRAVNNRGGGTAISASKTTKPRRAGPPGVPRNLSATPGIGQVALDWDAPESDGGSALTRYEYHYQVSGGNWSSWSSVGLATDATQTGLEDNTTYNFEVRAVNKHGFGTAASRSATTPEANTPSAPRNLTATPSTGQVALSWSVPASDGSSPITRYEYRWRADSGTWSPWSSVGLATSTTRTGLSANTTYNFQVRAVNAHGGGAIASRSATTPSPPTPPANTPSAPQQLDGHAGHESSGAELVGTRVEWRLGDHAV